MDISKDESILVATDNENILFINLLNSKYVNFINY
jgi:hypothetical protein